LVDTDILVDVGRGVTDAAGFLVNAGKTSNLAISTVTEMELVVGCRNNAELSQLDEFLGTYKRIRLTEKISDDATGLLRQFRLSHGLLIPDALIAATARAGGIAFVTKNQKHYQFIPDLALIPYP
jgi:predicted nucleic acid-binding protein